MVPTESGMMISLSFVEQKAHGSIFCRPSGRFSFSMPEL